MNDVKHKTKLKRILACKSYSEFSQKLSRTSVLIFFKKLNLHSSQLGFKKFGIVDKMNKSIFVAVKKNLLNWASLLSKS